MEAEPLIEEKFKDFALLIETSVPIAQKMGIRVVAMRERYAKLMLPPEPNLNHIGIIYAGSLFTLGEFSGGAIYVTAFDTAKYYPIVKEVSIRYRRPGTTRMYLEVEMSAARVAQIVATLEEKGKADFELDLELKDESGEVCALVHGTWQLRKLAA